MSNNLYVDSTELTSVSEEIDGLLNEFNKTKADFDQKLQELGNYWNGADYVSMTNNIKRNLNPITNEDGEVPVLMKSMSNELKNKAQVYTNIQRKNMGYWGD